MTNADVIVKFELNLDDTNFVLATLNKNPLGAEVTQVFTLISVIRERAQAAFDEARKADEARAVEEAPKRRGRPPNASKTAIAEAAAEAAGPDPLA